MPSISDRIGWHNPYSIALLEYALYRNGTKLPITGPYIGSRPALDENNVKELKPGAIIIQKINISAKYKDLTPGLYELIVTYNNNLTAYGMTSISINSKVFINVVKKTAEE